MKESVKHGRLSLGENSCLMFLISCRSHFVPDREYVCIICMYESANKPALHEWWLIRAKVNVSSYILGSFILLALRPKAGYGLLIHEVSRSYTKTHQSRKDSSGRVISSSQRPPQHTTLTTDKLLCPQGDSNPQSQ